MTDLSDWIFIILLSAGASAALLYGRATDRKRAKLETSLDADWLIGATNLRRKLREF